MAARKAKKVGVKGLRAKPKLKAKGKLTKAAARKQIQKKILGVARTVPQYTGRKAYGGLGAKRPLVAGGAKKKKAAARKKITQKIMGVARSVPQYTLAKKKKAKKKKTKVAGRYR
jgi:hypothetical protein